ncbi:hypothetical protein NliqN6_2883 [Naganishia liquefaciens]|uniref:Uncharacterized protein n=1 Tax=Naganishia liquefaciens TaxID=104408 RepID=A0A8H3TT44_9TREE|nr:hypothetical protein NliqN6_2883 [Naganishia liquefaciens]
MIRQQMKVHHSTVLEDYKAQAAAVPTKHAITTMTRPIKLKLRPRREEDAAQDRKRLSPLGKLVKVTEEADGACGSSTSIGKPDYTLRPPPTSPPPTESDADIAFRDFLSLSLSDLGAAEFSEKAEETSDATETIIDWRRAPSVHSGEEQATRLGSGGEHGARGQNQQLKDMAGPEREMLQSHGRDVAEPARHAAQGTPDNAANPQIQSMSIQINSGYLPLASCDPYPQSAVQHMIPGTVSSNGGQIAFDAYDSRSFLGRQSYQPLNLNHPSSGGFAVTSDVHSLSANHPPIATNSHLRSTLPYQAIQNREMKPAGSIAVEHREGSKASVITSQTSDYVSLNGCLAYQSSISAASMAVPSLVEERSRSKSSITPTPASLGMPHRAGPFTHGTTHEIDPALAKRDSVQSSYGAHLADGKTMYLATQSDHLSRHPPKQPFTHAVYSQLEPILLAPPSKAAQIEHLVFHVSPLSHLEEWDFAFYLACCWDGNPAMLRSTCALYQQWISAGLQRTEDLVSYFLYSQQSIMANIQHFRKSRPGRMSFNPANRQCDNCFGTSPTLVPPSKEKPPQKQIRLCKDCGNAMATFQDDGNYFHIYTLERRKLVAFHVEGIHRTLREMGFPIEGGERPSS